MSVGNKMFKGAIWSAIERIALKAMTFGLNLVLARLLAPTEYGTIGLLAVFITVSQVFVDSGFTKALIQKKDRDENDITTVFIFNIAIGVFFYGLLYLTAPLISKFYEIPILVPLLKVMALSLIINALFTVPATLLTINMDFKSIAKINLISVFISGVISIYLAYIGYGVWALVWQTILRSALMAILMWYYIRWIPKGQFSKSSFKQLFSYGSKLLVSSLLSNIFSSLNALLIGKYINAKQLGIYTRGVQFSDVVFSVFNTSLGNILLPGLAPIQDQKELLYNQIEKTIKISALITAPIFLGLAIMAEPIVRVLLTDKWIMAVPIMQVYCVARFITIFCGINVNLLYVIGRTDLVLKQEYFCIGIRVVLVILALKFGIFYIALAELVATTIHFFINSYFPGKIMSFGALKQIKSMGPVLLSALIMILPLFVMTRLIEDDIIQLVAAPIIAVSFYYFCMKVFRIKEFFILQNKLIETLNRSKS